MIILYSLFSIILNCIIIPCQIYNIYISSTLNTFYIIFICFNFMNVVQNVLIIKHASNHILYAIKTLFVDMFSIFITGIFLLKNSSYDYSSTSTIVTYISIFKIINDMFSSLYNTFREFKCNVASSRILPAEKENILNIISTVENIKISDKCDDCINCAICLNCFYCEENGEVRITFCKHLYHSNCLTEFVQHEKLKLGDDLNILKELKCPLCKSILFK
jgi:hypothetical protein